MIIDYILLSPPIPSVTGVHRGTCHYDCPSPRPASLRREYPPSPTTSGSLLLRVPSGTGLTSSTPSGPRCCLIRQKSRGTCVSGPETGGFRVYRTPPSSRGLVTTSSPSTPPVPSKGPSPYLGLEVPPSSLSLPGRTVFLGTIVSTPTPSSVGTDPGVSCHVVALPDDHH